MIKLISTVSKNIAKVIIITFGILIIIGYYLFEKKNNSFSSIKKEQEKTEKKARFTKIKKTAYVAYIISILLVLILINFVI